MPNGHYVMCSCQSSTVADAAPVYELSMSTAYYFPLRIQQYLFSGKSYRLPPCQTLHPPPAYRLCGAKRLGPPHRHLLAHHLILPSLHLLPFLSLATPTPPFLPSPPYRLVSAKTEFDAGDVKRLIYALFDVVLQTSHDLEVQVSTKQQHSRSTANSSSSNRSRRRSNRAVLPQQH